MKQYNNITIKQLKKGFGLIEVLIASGILIMVVSSTVFLGRMAIRNTIISSERGQAYNLAREGLELVRSLRDTRWINKQPDEWNEDFTLDDSMKKYYKINWQSQTLDLTTEDNPEERMLDQNQFFRLIIVEKINNRVDNETKKYLDSPVDYNNTDNQMLTKITVMVSWDSYSQSRKVETATFLSNWKPGL